MQAVILAGGKGTRLQARLDGLPKPMARLGGKPLLERQVDLLRYYGISDVLMLLAYRPESIVDYFGDGQDFGVRIRYVIEESPLGSAGAVLGAFEELEDTFFVLYGDTALNVDLERFRSFHRTHAAEASLLVHPNDHPEDSDLVEMDESQRVSGFHPYPRRGDGSYANLVNAALYILEKKALSRWRVQSVPNDFGRDLFPAMVKAGQAVFGYRSREYIKDVGTPERLDETERDLKSGRIGRSSYETPAAAVFLDRDGTVNEEVGRVREPGQFQLLPGAGHAIRKLNRAGYVVVLVSNQPVVARGDCTEQTLREITNKMETLLGREGGYLDAIYYCLHHPDGGFPGERPEFKYRCECRKPEPGMIEAARRDLNLDLSKSWFVGDSETDIRTARRAGIPGILVETGLVGRDDPEQCQPDYRFPALSDAADFLADKVA